MKTLIHLIADDVTVLIIYIGAWNFFQCLMLAYIIGKVDKISARQEGRK